MKEEERQKQIASLTVRLTALNNERDSLQTRLCTTISNIDMVREQLRNLGYTHPKASGV